MPGLRYAIGAKGAGKTIKRFLIIARAYGITPKRMEHNLNLFEGILTKYSCSATFPITAVVLEKHEKMVQGLQKKGLEFAIHGLVHRDYSMLTLSEQEDQIQKAVKIFRDANINVHGFRGPYFGCDENTLAVLNNANLLYESDETILWDVIEDESMEKHKNSVNKILQLYKSKKSEEYRSLPCNYNGLIRIPVSLPDDEIIMDRLNITEPPKINEIWKSLLEQSYGRGELFTLQLHPERIERFANSLESVLAEARNKSPIVWIAQLREIAKWWKERKKFSIEIKGKDKEYVVDIDCSDEATILLKNINIETEQAKEWYSDYKTIDSNVKSLKVKVKSGYHPFIGVSPSAPEGLVSLLKEEGFYVEESTAKDKFKIYFEHNDFEEKDKLSIIQKIDGSDAPLVRIWRWPRDARSALSITGDIDAMSIWDYVRRFV